MRILSRSVVGRALATLVVIGLFVVLYEATTSDSTEVAAVDTDRGAPAPGAVLQFAATAYCKGTTTASGVVVRTGIAAADPTLLPVGSVVNVATDTLKYNGVYTIMDTGPKVQGRLLDLYMWSCYEALDFGRKPVRVTVLRLGWESERQRPKPHRSTLPRTRTGSGRAAAASCSGATGSGPGNRDSADQL